MHLSFVNLSRTLAAAVLLAPLGLTQERSIKPYLPASTVMVVSLPDINASFEQMMQMPLAKMWAEDEVQDFLADFVKMAHEYWEQGVEQVDAAAEMGIPVNADDLMKLRLDGLTFAVTKLDVEVGPMGPIPEIGIMVHLDFGQSAPIWNGFIDMALGMAVEVSEGMVSMATSEIGDFTLTTLTPEIPDGPEVSLNIARVGNGIVFGTIKDELVSTLQSMSDGEPVLTASETYRAAFEHIDTDGAEAETYVRVGPLIDFGIQALAIAAEMQPELLAIAAEMQPELQAIAAEMQPELLAIDIAGLRRVIDVLGLSSIQAVGTAFEYQDGVSVTRSYVVSSDNQRAGLFAGAGGELDLDFLSWVPKDVVSFSASTLHVAGIYDTMFKAIQAYDPEMAEMVLEQIAMIEEQAGFNLRNDLIGTFGEKFITWSMPVGGVIGAAPEMAILVEVENQEGLLKSLNIISQLSEGALKIDTVERRGITAHQITMNMDLGADVMMNPLESYRPTFAFKDGFMVMGFSAGDVRRAFDRMDREPDPQGDIRGNEEFAPYLQRIPRQGLTSLSFTDWKASFEGIYQMMTAVLAFIPVTDEVPLDFALLPDSLTLTQHLSGGIFYSTADGNGFLSTFVSPFGPEIAAVGVAAGALAGYLYFSIF